MQGLSGSWFCKMFNEISAFTGLSIDVLPFFIAAMFLAGLIRGFSGFALSATVMACLSSFIAPIEIIPICFALEILAAVIMFRGGLKDADFSLVKGLAIGNFVGVPLGLFVLTQLDVSTSRIVALTMVMCVGTLLLFRVKASFLTTQKGPYIGGLTAGIASGIASIGGMVVALFVLTLDKTAKEIRASLIIYLMIAMVSSVIYLILYEIMTLDAIKRALVASPIMIAGVLVGSALFRPNFAKYYKPICLLVLLVICALGLFRQLIS